MDRLSAKNGHFTDSRGNIILLRGVNLSGSSKVPFFPDGNTAYDQGASFSSPESVSFVGRPFPIEEAEEHLERLKRWGFNFIRFIITWEAVEHGGPGIYDEDYIEYIGQIVSIAEKKGIYLFIDPHQDVWSRFTGGDGAPAWTLETVGIDVRKLPSTSTVILHHVRKENYRRMSWPLNYQKYPAASMFTVFFGGNFFAQGLKVDSMPIQDWLQERYISACLRIAVRIAKNKNVVGFDSLNEPSPGWI
nr:cellulase family glycosylhydrolase [Leptospiraceae bacterium]